MKRILSLTILSLALTLMTSSCHREKPVYSELGKPKYEIKDGKDYISHTIYDIYKKCGVQIIYRFDPEDALWDLGRFTTTLQKPRYTVIDPEQEEDRQMLERSIRHLQEHFFSAYDDNFKSRYFPLRIFLADTIGTYKNSNNRFATGYRDHMAINLYRDGEVLKYKQNNGRNTSYKTLQEYRQALIPSLHSQLWEFVFQYRIAPPERFLFYSQDMYGENIGRKDDPNYDIRMSGFWDYDEFNSGAKWYRAYKSPSLDIADYIYRMTSMSEKQIKEAMGAYQIMHDKYDALREHIQSLTGFDIQTIGDRAAQE